MAVAFALAFAVAFALAFAVAFAVLSVIPEGNLLLHDKAGELHHPAVAFAVAFALAHTVAFAVLSVIPEGNLLLHDKAGELTILPLPLLLHCFSCLSFPKGICFSPAPPQLRVTHSFRAFCEMSGKPPPPAPP